MARRNVLKVPLMARITLSSQACRHVRVDCVGLFSLVFFLNKKEGEETAVHVQTSQCGWVHVAGACAGEILGLRMLGVALRCSAVRAGRGARDYLGFFGRSQDGSLRFL